MKKQQRLPVCREADWVCVCVNLLEEVLVVLVGFAGVAPFCDHLIGCVVRVHLDISESLIDDFLLEGVVFLELLHEGTLLDC